MFVYRTVQRILYFSCLILLLPTMISFIINTNHVIKSTIYERDYIIPKLKLTFVLNYLLMVSLIGLIGLGLISIKSERYKLIYTFAILMTLMSMVCVFAIELDPILGQFRGLFTIITSIYSIRFGRMAQLRDRIIKKPIPIYNADSSATNTIKY